MNNLNNEKLIKCPTITNAPFFGKVVVFKI